MSRISNQSKSFFAHYKLMSHVGKIVQERHIFNESSQALRIVSTLGRKICDDIGLLINIISVPYD